MELAAALTAAFEHAPFGVAVLDLDSQRWVVTNPALADMLGYTRDELAGMSVAALTHPEDRDTIDGAMELVRSVSVTVTKRYLHRDGSVVWARVSGRLVADTQPRLVIVHIEDITAQRRSEERARIVLDALRDGIIVRDPRGAPLEWNKAYLELVGLDADQLVGRTPVPPGWRLLHADGTPIDRVPRPTERLIPDVVIGVEAEGRTTRWLRANSIQLANGDVVTSFADETARVQTDREVQLGRDRFTALVEHSRDLITVLIPGAGAFDYTSPAWHRLLGWNPGELDFDGLSGRIHPDDFDNLTDVMMDVIGQPGGIRHLVFRVRHADGTWRHLDTTITNLVDNPAVGGIVLNSSDVTQQVEAEAELREQALHDGLTGLPNRRLVVDRIGQAVEEQRREGTAVAVLFLDLDDFKGVNDAYGHAAGDELLVAVAGRLSGAVRAVDTVGRMGGDEFVVVASLRELDGAASVARHIEDALREPVAVSGGIAVNTRASIGIVVSRPDHPMSPDELLGEADSAMYEVKRRRRHLRAVN